MAYKWIVVALCFTSLTQGRRIETRPLQSKNRCSKLVIDHDGGADDAMAIFMALLYEKYFDGPQVIAITTSHANVDEPQVYVNTQRILDVAGRTDVPIFRGSNHSLVHDVKSDAYFGEDGLGDQDPGSFEAIDGETKHAVWALIEMAKTYRENLRIVALGAQTNIALAIRLYPQFIDAIGHLYVGAGNVYDADNPQANEPEFNALNDAEAYYVVMQNATPEKVTVVPFTQIKTSLKLTVDWRVNVLGSIQTKIMKAQNSFERVSIQHDAYWALLDPAAMAVALQPAVVDVIKYSNNTIYLSGELRGINHNIFTDLSKANVQLLYAAKEDVYKDFLLHVFSAELLQPRL